jgi:hypothetical protein
MAHQTQKLQPVHLKVLRHSNEVLWSQVRAVHAQWQVTEPSLRLSDTVCRLLTFALDRAEEIPQAREEGV